MMLKSIFYARFHQEKGSTVLHQVPEGSVIPCLPSPVAQEPLFDYKSIANYIIPPREFCDRLVTICTNKHRIIGFPVCIHNVERYSRNEFIFNFCLVLDEEAPYAAYASVIRKLARLFRNLEEQGQFLSAEEDRGDMIVAGEVGYGGGSKVYALCEMILEDLNNYCECMIPIDDSNTVNLKLFPTRSPPPPIHTWHVPLSLVNFSSLATHTWDLTVQRIIPWIDGVNSVARIAAIADTDITLTRRAIAHLLYYGCVCLLDIFQFSAIYAPTAEIGVFFANEKMQDECRRYIASPYSPFGKSSSISSNPIISAGNNLNTDASGKPSIAPARGGSRLNPANAPPTTISETFRDTKDGSTEQAAPPIPSRATLLTLYSSLRQGLPLRDWCLLHSSLLSGIDIRRFITFGKIKGFVYRCHTYAIALKPTDLGAIMEGEDLIAAAKRQEKEWRKAAMSSGWTTPLAKQSHEEKMRKQGGMLGSSAGTVVGVKDGPSGVGAGGGSLIGAAMGGAADEGDAGRGRAGVLELSEVGLARYLDGLHCLDEICTELKLPERDTVKKLRRAGGDVVFLHR